MKSENSKLEIQLSEFKSSLSKPSLLNSINSFFSQE